MDGVNVEYHKWWSERLSGDMIVKVYGSRGVPLLVFPTAKGKFHEFEDFGMVNAVKDHLEHGRLKIFCVDGRDWETWMAENTHPADKVKRYMTYLDSIVYEVIPFIHNHHGNRSDRKIMTCGASMGAYHAANFYLKHPDIVDHAICLSGLYTMQDYYGEYMDENIYYNDPLLYLPNLSDPWYLENLSKGKLKICVGQGAHEAQCLDTSKRLAAICDSKGIPHELDIWGTDVSHDWIWWRVMFPHLIGPLV